MSVPLSGGHAFIKPLQAKLQSIAFSVLFNHTAISVVCLFVAQIHYFIENTCVQQRFLLLWFESAFCIVSSPCVFSTEQKELLFTDGWYEYPKLAKAIVLQVETPTTIMPFWLRFGRVRSQKPSPHAAFLRMWLSALKAYKQTNTQTKREEVEQTRG